MAKQKGFVISEKDLDPESQEHIAMNQEDSGILIKVTDEDQINRELDRNLEELIYQALGQERSDVVMKRLAFRDQDLKSTVVALLTAWSQYQIKL